MELTKPDTGRDHYHQKFVRVGQDMYVTEPDDIRTQHETLAIQDGIRGRVSELSRTEPNEVDAGYLLVINGPDSIGVQGDSYTLSVPTVPEARARTVEVLSEKVPEYTIFEY